MIVSFENGAVLCMPDTTSMLSGGLEDSRLGRCNKDRQREASASNVM